MPVSEIAHPRRVRTVYPLRDQYRRHHLRRARVAQLFTHGTTHELTQLSLLTHPMGTGTTD